MFASSWEALDMLQMSKEYNGSQFTRSSSSMNAIPAKIGPKFEMLLRSPRSVEILQTSRANRGLDVVAFQGSKAMNPIFMCCKCLRSVQKDRSHAPQPKFGRSGAGWCCSPCQITVGCQLLFNEVVVVLHISCNSFLENMFAASSLEN